MESQTAAVSTGMNAKELQPGAELGTLKATASNQSTEVFPVPPELQWLEVASSQRHVIDTGSQKSAVCCRPRHQMSQNNGVAQGGHCATATQRIKMANEPQ